jgi:hypothetical protein
MPIVTSTHTGGNISEWSHSTVFTKYQSTYQAPEVPSLTTLWTAPTGCSNRWMAVTFTILTTSLDTVTETIVSLIPDRVTETIVSIGVDVPTRLITKAALSPRDVPAPTSLNFVPVSETHTSSREDLSSGIFVAVSTNPGNPGNPNSSALYDRSYTLCQPYSSLYHYSPGICPYGQTVAEITEYHYATTSGSTATRFEASCCERYTSRMMTPP